VAVNGMFEVKVIRRFDGYGFRHFLLIRLK
jgi:hypothetical protein